MCPDYTVPSAYPDSADAVSPVSYTPLDVYKRQVLDNGELNGFGTHEELLQTNAIYRDVYESQTGGGGDFDEGGAA